MVVKAVQESRAWIPAGLIVGGQHGNDVCGTAICFKPSLDPREAITMPHELMGVCQLDTGSPLYPAQRQRVVSMITVLCLGREAQSYQRRRDV